MARKQSILAPDWWDYTTLEDELLNDAARCAGCGIWGAFFIHGLTPRGYNIPASARPEMEKPQFPTPTRQ